MRTEEDIREQLEIYEGQIKMFERAIKNSDNEAKKNIIDYTRFCFIEVARMLKWVLEEEEEDD